VVAHRRIPTRASRWSPIRGALVRARPAIGPPTTAPPHGMAPAAKRGHRPRLPRAACYKRSAQLSCFLVLFACGFAPAPPLSLYLPLLPLHDFSLQVRFHFSLHVRFRGGNLRERRQTNKARSVPP
jgi:hypothetical protein